MPRRKDAPKASPPPEPVKRRRRDDAAAPSRVLVEYEALPDHIKAVASVPGKRSCQCCQKEFFSADVARLRFCPKCRQNNHDAPREVSTSLFGQSVLDQIVD